MTKITREEILKLGELSKIEILDEEIEFIAKQLQDVLTYAHRVKEVAVDLQINSGKNINVFAQDIIDRTDPEPILAQAPESENHFFIVPKILEGKES